MKTMIFFKLGAYFVVLLSLIVVMGSFWMPAEKWEIANQPQESRALQPESVQRLSETERLFTFDLSDKASTDDCIFFMGLHQELHITADGKEIYTVTMTPNPFNSSTGASRNYVQFPHDVKTVEVYMKSAYGITNDAPVLFFTGNAYAMLRESVKKNALEIFICLMDVVLGLFLIVYYLTYRKHTEVNKATFYLGVFATMVGIWAVNETDFSALLISNRGAASNLAFLILANVTPILVLFIKNYMGDTKNIANYICLVSYANTFLLIVLQLLGVSRFKESFAFTVGTMCLGLLYFVVIQLVSIKKEGLIRRNIISLIAAIVFSAAVGFDFVLYYTSVLQATYAGRVGLLLYLAIIGAETIFESLEQIEAGRKAGVYKELAVTDLLTRLANRNAYTEWEENPGDIKDIIIVNLDLNSLKYYNDNFGHACGDEYIASAAKIIEKTFGNVGKCYRIGGDEFCVVLENMVPEYMDSYFSHMHKLEDEYNQTSEIIKIEIAYGYAVYDEKLDNNNVEKTRNRADQNMYKVKQEMKANKYNIPHTKAPKAIEELQDFS